MRLKARLARLAFRCARSRAGGHIVGWSFAHMSPWLPVHRRYETDRVVAFDHPAPTHEVHILIVPKRAIASLLDLSDEDQPYVGEILAAARHLVAELGLDRQGFRLVVNGGPYQEVRQLHFHLIAGQERD